MTKWTLAGSTALATLAFGSVALAGVTPEDVWKSWQDMSASSGQKVTATSETRDGDTLLVEGMRIEARQDGVLVVGEIDELFFTDIGEGIVEITMSDEYPLTITMDPDEGETKPTTVKILVKQPGLTMSAGGGDGETGYDFDAPLVSIAVESIDGVDAAVIDLVADLVFTGMVGTYLNGAPDAASDTRDMTTEFGATNMAVNVAFKDPESQGALKLSVSVADISGYSESTLIGGALMADLAAALKTGFASDGGFNYGKTVYDFSFADETENAASNGQADSGGFTFSMDEDHLAYAGDGKGVTMVVSGSQIPFPELAASFAEATFDLLMPISKSDVAEDFKLVTRIVDLTVSDVLWGMIDPTSQLPRDPATLVVDATGTAKLAFDIMDPAQQAVMGEASPGDLESLNINAVQLKIAGAELTGAGAFTFDNTDLVTFEGMPAPTGKLEMKLVGGNGLLDKLVAMGLIPDDQAMGARMMMGMFARPGDGVDTLTSTIEFKDKGLFANGQRLQ